MPLNLRMYTEIYHRPCFGYKKLWDTIGVAINRIVPAFQESLKYSEIAFIHTHTHKSKVVGSSCRLYFELYVCIEYNIVVISFHYNVHVMM